MIKDFVSRTKNYVKHLGKGKMRENVAFIHIPKCGGTSLATAIRQHYITLDPRDDRLIGHLDAVAAYKAAMLLGQDPVAYNRDILFYYLGHNYRYVYGHFAFNTLAFETFAKQYVFITMLRDPVQKWLSLYFYNRYKGGDHYKITDDLETFLQTETAVSYGYDYAMQFAGRDTDDDFTSQAAIDRAIQNLSRFHLVGIIEEKSLFIDNFQTRFKVQLNLPRLRSNPISKAKQSEMVTPAMYEKIKTICQPNMEIYEYARENLIHSYR